MKPLQSLDDTIAHLEKQLALLRDLRDLRKFPMGSLCKMEHIERLHINAVLQRTGSVTESSEILGVARRTLHRKINRWKKK